MNNNQTEKWLLDDFEDLDVVSTLNTSWQGFTDRVMGGRSDMNAGLVVSRGENSLGMKGEVSLENNGGFIQVRLPLAENNRPVDALPYDGVFVRVRGNGGPYFIHLRTRSNRVPWSYFVASVEVDEEWSTVEIPWGDFFPENSFSRSPDIRQLTSLAVVAAKKEFRAEIYLSEIGFYKDEVELTLSK